MTSMPVQIPVKAGAGGREVVPCTQCGVAVPPGLVRPGATQQWCCRGCEAAYGVINGTGPAIEGSARRFAQYDDATFQTLYCRPDAAGLLRAELLLEGVHCAACLQVVERLPHVLPGVRESRLDIGRAALSLVFDPTKVQLSRVARTLDAMGYRPHPARSLGAGESRQKGAETLAVREARRVEDRRMMVRIAVAGACAGNIMLLFFALYAGMFEGMESGFATMFRWVAMSLNTVCLAWPGLVFAKSAIAAIRTRSINLDVPIALGLYLGGAWGLWKTVAGTSNVVGAGTAQDIYFDSISALIFFLLIGRFVHQRQQRSAADSLAMLFSVTPTVARRIEADGVVVEVPAEALVVGDLVEVKAGDNAPADGVVVDGRSSVDVSLLTGESRPVPVVVGDLVVAGSVNLTSSVRMRVEAAGSETRIARLMRIVEDAAKRRAAIVLLADRWGAWLLWILLGLSAITLAIWWHEGATVAIDRAAALLIATCPCGLGLATPLAMTVAIGRAARQGILVKGGDALQSLASTVPGRTIVLDKTGTITQGRMAMVRWIGDESARPLVASLEKHSSHPAARALARDVNVSGVAAPEAVGVSQHAGAGIDGNVGGRWVAAGTLAFMKTLGAVVPRTLGDSANAMAHDGQSPVYVAVDATCVGVAGMGDPIRPDARSAIDALRRRGWNIAVLSGDHPQIVESIARMLGLNPADCRAGVTPEGKLAAIREMVAKHPAVMVGDGVNDAAALAAATVGISVRGGAEASLAAADVSISREGLTPIVDLLEGARLTMRTIHWTIAASLAYNVLAATLSMMGVISPLLAAFIMPASSFTVLTICVRSGAFKTGTVIRGKEPATEYRGAQSEEGAIA
jgi:Cu2+-exporting ATPase